MATLVPAAPATGRRFGASLVGALSMCLAMLLWVILEAVGGRLVSPTLPLYQVVWGRYAVHLLAMLLFIVPWRRWRLLATRRPGLQVGRGLLMLTMPASFISALPLLPGEQVLAQFWLAPVLIVVLARLLNGAAWRWWPLAASVIGAVGAFLAWRPATLVGGWAVLWPVGMAASFGLYLVLTERLQADGTLTNVFYSALVVFVPLTLVLPTFWQWPTLTDLIALVVIGLVGLGVLTALDLAIARGGPAALAPFTLTQPLIMMVAAISTGALVPGRGQWLGIALLVGALLLAVVGLRQPPVLQERQ